MKASVSNEVKSKLRQPKGKSKTKSAELNDPTLEGRDESKIGRIQKKL
jgi:hypothetical protein